MKHFISFSLFSLLLFIPSVMVGQVMIDDFETNQYGWTEYAGTRGIAVIQEGTIHIESKSSGMTSTCYGPFDVSKPFVLTVDALAKKIDDDKIFGILLDYEDDQNYILFYVCEGEANLEVRKENEIIGKKQEALKLIRGKYTDVKFEVQYNLYELIFYVNGVKAMTYRRRVAKDEFLLGTSGIGFYARGGQVVDFDNLQIDQ